MTIAASLIPFCLALSLWGHAPDGFALLRAGRTAEAREAFQAQLHANERDADAWLGAGLVALRQDRLIDARAFFAQALELAPGYADAGVGLARCLQKEGRTAEAIAALEKLAKDHPDRADIREELVTLSGLPPPADQAPFLRPAVAQIPARARDRHLEIATGDLWRPFYVKGMNLGAALPGKYPSEFPDRATYEGWIAEMAELGINAIRVYTVHPPQFYSALREHNLRTKKPIWLIHGVWAELPPRHDFQNVAWKAAWFEDMGEVVQVLHGRARLGRRPGRAGGAFTADVSPWTLAIILGREWESSSVVACNRLHPGSGDWSGRFVTVKGGHAMERFLAESMDHFLALEWDGFHAQRPIAFTNWPTLDPLFHVTESSEREEAEFRRKLGEAPGPLSEEPNDEDAVGLDMEKFSGTPLLQAGLFASYHVYPYYPDFMNLDPGYARTRDHQGPSNYLGYLNDLVQHHQKHPVLVAEFGVPSSRLVAHWQPQGMTHGGQNEREQGEHDARLQRDIYEAGCTGAVLFAWIDEWFKKNWLTMPFEHPLDRKPLWYNEMDAEENYGLIAYRPGAKGPNILIDGKATDWDNVPVYLEGQGHTLKVQADEGWLHLGLFVPGPVDFTKHAFLVGLDTIDSRRGDHRLPWGANLGSEAGLEFVALFQGEGRTGVFVDEPYLLPDHRFDPQHRYRSVANEEGRFVMGTARSNNARIGRDGRRFEGHSTEIGWLQRGTQDRRDAAYDDRAEWQVGRSTDGRGFLEARIPWTLLNVTDPSASTVIDDPVRKVPGPVGTATTPGFRLLLAVFDAEHPLWEGGGSLSLSLPTARQGRIPMPPLFSWAGWEQPTFHRYRKRSFEIYQKALTETPDEPRLPR